MEMFGKIITILSIIVFIMFVIFSFTGLHIKTTENGEHTGYVTAIERNGWLFKTYTLYFKTNAESTQEDVYCIKDEELIKQLREVQEKRELITIQFYDVMFWSITECKSESAMIDGFKETSEVEE